MYDRPMFLVHNRIARGYPGGREIDRFRGVPDPKDDDRPEAWVGSTTFTYRHTLEPSNTDGLSEVYSESGKKLFLKDVIETQPEAYLGTKHVAAHGSNTGLLVKLLDAQKQLGLQTHPNREFAKRMFNSKYGKVESWYVIGTRNDQDEEPYVYLGFREGITRKQFERLFRTGNIKAMEDSCHRIPVSVDEMYFVDAGVPHAIGPGCFVIEVQEPSDITVGARMRHFDDPNEEHEFVERTMGCYEYTGRSYEDNLAACRIPPRVFREEAAGIETLLLGSEQTPFFSITKLDVYTELQTRQTGAFSIAIILAGNGEIVCETGRWAVKQGDELFLPARMRRFSWRSHSNLQIINCHPPGVL